MASTPVTPARRAALDVSSAVRDGLRLDVAFGRVARALESRDRAFAHELSFGVGRLRGRLDHLLHARVRGGLERLDPPVLDVLRLGAYQVLYMGSVPRYAAISQSVEQAAEVAGRGAGGLVNAVLRAVASAGDGAELFPAPDRDPVGYLTAWGSHPQWLVERWLAQWSFDDVLALVQGNNRQPPLTLVPLEESPLEAASRLMDEGLDARVVGEGTDCVRLLPGTDPAEALRHVRGLIQDPGANLVSRYADPPEGTKIADLCAAPGGKALLSARRASFIVAADRSEVRMRRLRQNAVRTGTPLGLVVADGRRPPLRAMDVVTLDVPCTGTGTLRRHPDGRWRLRPATLTELVRVQHELIDGAASLVAPGGLLVYSTCSLEPEENHEQVAAFRARNPDFRVEATDAVPARYRDAGGHLVVHPWRTGFDGAFAARLRRAS